MGKLKKTAESGQLWEQYLSAVFFLLQKTRIILLNAVLTPQESLKNFVLERTEEEKGEKGKKHVAVVW